MKRQCFRPWKGSVTPSSQPSRQPVEAEIARDQTCTHTPWNGHGQVSWTMVMDNGHGHWSLKARDISRPVVGSGSTGDGQRRGGAGKADTKRREGRGPGEGTDGNS